jgi:hypothetical protein
MSFSGLVPPCPVGRILIHFRGFEHAMGPLYASNTLEKAFESPLKDLEKGVWGCLEEGAHNWGSLGIQLGGAKLRTGSYTPWFGAFEETLKLIEDTYVKSDPTPDYVEDAAGRTHPNQTGCQGLGATILLRPSLKQMKTSVFLGFPSCLEFFDFHVFSSWYKQLIVMSPAAGKLVVLLKLRNLDDIDYHDPDLMYHHEGWEMVHNLYRSTWWFQLWEIIWLRINIQVLNMFFKMVSKLFLKGPHKALMFFKRPS